MEIPASTERVAIHTAPHVNEKLYQSMEQRLLYYLDHQNEITSRLKELDEEWDIERALEANAAVLSLTGLALGSVISRSFFLFPAVVAGFLLQHAVQGWCPPVPVLRRLGFRTSYEIELERYALKALRGDFESVGSKMPAGRFDLRERTLEAVQMH